MKDLQEIINEQQSYIMTLLEVIKKDQQKLQELETTIYQLRNNKCTTSEIN